jgi:hypothetical protein
MEKNREILLPSKRYKKADEQEISIKIDLENTEVVLRNNDRDIVLDVAKIFDDERNKSNQYKIYGKIKMVFRNMYSGLTTYPQLYKSLYLIDSEEGFDGYLPYDEFAFIRKDIYREEYVPSTGTTYGFGNTPIRKTNTNNSHKTITSVQSPYFNWNLYLSYVYSHDTSYPLKYTLSGDTVYDFISGDGIPFRVVNNDFDYTLISPVKHGIRLGEYIVISGVCYDIDGVGNGIYESENYSLTINKSQLSGQTLNNVVFGKRCLDRTDVGNSTSQYYVQKHKTLTNVDDYNIDNIGFESNIFEEERKILSKNNIGEKNVLVERNRMESIIYDFKSPFILSGITNNLGYLPTEIYLTNIFKNTNGYFNYPPKIGYSFNFHNTWIDEQFEDGFSVEKTIPFEIFTKSGFTFECGLALPKGTILMGAFVEYNEKELKERVISNSFHKITNPTSIFDYNQDDGSFSGSTKTNPVGLYYQVHNMIKLREVSQYIETSKSSNIYNLPDTSKFDTIEKEWRWREIYTHGYIDDEGNGTNFPFVNNLHYVKNDFNLYFKNEKYYTNKEDGIKKINDNSDILNC